MGEIMAAVVSMATVAEPWAMRMMAATSQEIKIRFMFLPSMRA